MIYILIAIALVTLKVIHDRITDPHDNTSEQDASSLADTEPPTEELAEHAADMKEKVDMNEKRDINMLTCMTLQELRAVTRKLPKDQVLVLSVKCLDGLGDFAHFEGFADLIKELDPNLKMVGIIQLLAINEPLCNQVIKFLESEKAKKLFERLIIQVDKDRVASGVVDLDIPFDKRDDNYVKRLMESLISPHQELNYVKRVVESLILPYQESYKLLNELKAFVLFEISALGHPYNGPGAVAIDDWIKIQRSQNKSYQFEEFSQTTTTLDCAKNRISSHPMGPLRMRLDQRFREVPSQEERAKALLSLSSSNKAFLQCLLQQKEPDSKGVDEYRKTRKFFPGNLQGKPETAYFILTMILTYQKFGLDFHLPKESIDSKILFEILREINIKAEIDVTIIDDMDLSLKEPEERAKKSSSEGDRKDIVDQKSQEEAIKTLHTRKDLAQMGHQYKVRIFVNNIEGDAYKNLYRFAEEFAGASGDDTIPTVFSSTCIPFITLFSGLKFKFLKKLVSILESDELQKPFLALYFRYFFDGDKKMAVTLRENDLEHGGRMLSPDQVFFYTRGQFCTDDSKPGAQFFRRTFNMDPLLVQKKSIVSFAREFSSLLTAADDVIESLKKEWMECRQYLFLNNTLVKDVIDLISNAAQLEIAKKDALGSSKTLVFSAAGKPGAGDGKSQADKPDQGDSIPQAGKPDKPGAGDGKSQADKPDQSASIPQAGKPDRPCAGDGKSRADGASVAETSETELPSVVQDFIARTGNRSDVRRLIETLRQGYSSSADDTQSHESRTICFGSHPAPGRSNRQ